MKQLILSLCLCFLCGAMLPVFANTVENDVSKRPPTRPYNLVEAHQYESSVQLVFLASSANTQIEVSTLSGASVYENGGSVNEHSSLEIDTRNWLQGTYVIRIKTIEGENNVIILECR